MISPLFTTIVLVAGFIWMYMKITTKNMGKADEDLIEKELRANSVRRQPLNTLNYIRFNSSSIPEIDHSINPTIDNLMTTLESLYDQNIVDLTGITNTDLKLAYGPANLPELTMYDQNFDLLTRTLSDLGIQLSSCGHNEEAIAVLEYAISIGTDISACFLTLANIYVEAKRYSDITKLIEKAQTMHSLTKESTIKKLQEIQDTHTTVVVPLSTPVDNNKSDEANDIPLSQTSSSSGIFPDNIPPKDIRDILDSVLYTDHDQK